MLVLDCSVAMAWCFEDEATPALDLVLDQVQAEGAVVPGLWAIEVTNVLTQASRRGRLSPEIARERLTLLEMLQIETDQAGSGPGWRATVLALATAEALTAYDATYLELAIRRGLTVASSDAALRHAARRHGLVVLPT